MDQQQMQYAPQNGAAPAATQEWQNSLMDCGPCDLCMISCCVPCFAVGKTSERMRDPSMATYEPINTDCLVMLGISCVGFGWVYAMIKRGEIRERFGIKGDGCGDCCVSYWCGCCALIQQEKEVKGRLGAGQGPVMQGYQSGPKEGMQMPHN